MFNKVLRNVFVLFLVIAGFSGSENAVFAFDGATSGGGGPNFDEAAEFFAPLGSLLRNTKANVVAAGYVKEGDAKVNWSSGNGNPIADFVIRIRYFNASQSTHLTITARGKMRTTPPVGSEQDVQILYSVHTDVDIH